MKTNDKRLGLNGLLILGASLLLSACAQGPQPMYQWEGYQHQVYLYMKGEASAQQQIAEMEGDLQKIRAHGKTPPPGYYAHLGLLYANVGNSAMVVQDFQAEERLFPESAPYMDYLLSQNKK